MYIFFLGIGQDTKARTKPIFLDVNFYTSIGIEDRLMYFESECEFSNKYIPIDTFAQTINRGFVI